MIDIIAMVLLAVYNGKIATRKGLKAGQWRMYTVLAWILGEFIGTLVALQFYSIQDFFSPQKSFKVMLLVFPFAFAGFHIVYYLLNKQSDSSTQNNL